MLKAQLPTGGPMVHDVTRHLRVNCTAERLRRIMTMRNRRKKAGAKTRKLHTLKIPQRAVRLKLYKGSVQAGISWGLQAMGLAPQTRQRIKATMASQMGLQCTGNMDLVYDMQPRHKDPDCEAFVQTILGNWPEHLHRDLTRLGKFTKKD